MINLIANTKTSCADLVVQDRAIVVLPDSESLALLVAEAFSYGEDNGYYAYVYSIATRLERIYEKTWRDNTWLPPRDRYTKERLCVVPAGTLAAQNWQQRLLGGVKEHDTSILIRRLKKEYHANIDASSFT